VEENTKNRGFLEARKGARDLALSANLYTTSFPPRPACGGGQKQTENDGSGAKNFKGA